MPLQAAGNAISIVADSTVFADVADLVREPSYGIARQLPVEALPRIGGSANRDAVTEILIDLLSDDDVVLHAISAVRKIRACAARPALEHLSDHERDTVRRRPPSLRHRPAVGAPFGGAGISSQHNRHTP